MFFGSYDHVLDDKGRTSLPKDFRDVLSAEKEDPWITAGGRCLSIYTDAEFQRIRATLTADPLPDAAVVRQQRLVLGNATRCRVDGQGRILVPAILRTHAGLAREITFAGRGTLIEMWDRSYWRAEMERARSENP